MLLDGRIVIYRVSLKQDAKKIHATETKPWKQCTLVLLLHPIGCINEVKVSFHSVTEIVKLSWVHCNFPGNWECVSTLPHMVPKKNAVKWQNFYFGLNSFYFYLHFVWPFIAPYSLEYPTHISHSQNVSQFLSNIVSHYITPRQLSYYNYIIVQQNIFYPWCCIGSAKAWNINST